MEKETSSFLVEYLIAETQLSHSRMEDIQPSMKVKVHDEENANE